MISRAVLRKLTPDVIRQAIAERVRLNRLEAMAEKRRKLMTALALVDQVIKKLEGGTVPGRSGRRKGFKVSAATRERMRQAALRRHGKADLPEPQRKRRTLSAAGRAAIAAAQRARWAKLKGETKESQA